MSPRARSHRRTLSVFVSSPSDLNTERKAVSTVVDDLNRTIAPRLNLNLEADMWEDWRPRRDIKTHIKARLREVDYFVMIFARRYGTAATDPEVGSGTREEFDIAKELQQEHNGRPEIAVYFLDIPPDDPMHDDPGPQFQQVRDFKAELERDFFYHTYGTPELFESHFKSHLTDWIFTEWEKGSQRGAHRRNLRQFFSLHGDPPSATIVHVARAQHDSNFLLPWVAAEDFHAMLTIMDGLHLAGCTDVVTYNDREYVPEPHRARNKIFICAFRNPPGREALDKEAQCSFVLQVPSDPDDRSGRAILWRARDGERLTVSSPLAKYLELQREQEDDPVVKKGRVGVDFAVLARYRDEDDDADATSRIYVFGLRSLGTWGAAWFLETKIARRAVGVDQGRCYEALLRIEYFGSAIHDVLDVSSEGQEYFDRQMSKEFIEGQITRRTRH